MQVDAAIVGGGVSGLAAAYFLSQSGLRSVLIEKSPRLGGLIQTDRLEGCVLEAGPDSFLAAKPHVVELASRLGSLKDQIIGSNDAARRVFIVRHGRMVAMPRGMAMMTPGDWGAALGSNLFSVKTKLKFLQEFVQRPRSRKTDVALGQFVQDHFGAEMLEYVAEPLLMGVYGGNAADLSLRSVLPRFAAYEENYGSLIRAVRRERRNARQTGSLFLSFRDGMQSFTDAIAQAVVGHTNVIHAEAARVERTAGGWRVFSQSNCLAEARSVILACPAHRAAALVASEAPLLAQELLAIPYSSAILVTVVYRRDRLRHSLAGFGFLVPRTERRTVAAATFISTKFPSRIPPHLVAVRLFIVAKNAEELAAASDDDLLELVREDLKRLTGIDAAPDASVVRRWPQSMPQYVVGHEQRCQRIRAIVQGQPGLHLTGNAYQGIGIPDCVRLAKETAKQIAAASEPAA